LLLSFLPPQPSAARSGPHRWRQRRSEVESAAPKRGAETRVKEPDVGGRRAVGGGAIKGAITAVALVARDATGVRPSDT